MKIKAVAAAGALGVGLGIASFIGAGTASADCSTEGTPGYTPPLTPARVACVAQEQTNTFLVTTDPGYNYDLLMNGNPDPDSPTGRDGLGLKDQPQTFQDSVKDFFNGPRSPG